MMQPLRSSSGFTLIEFLIVLVVVGIALSIAMPRFAALRRGMQVDAAAQQLAGDLRRAQVEAIKRNRSIKLYRNGATTSYTIDSIGTRSFDAGIAFSGGSADSVRMAPFGPPVGGGARIFIVTLGTRQKTVTVSSGGLVTVR